MKLLKSLYITFFIYVSLLFFASGISHLAKDILLDPILGVAFLFIFLVSAVFAHVVSFFILKKACFAEIEGKAWSTMNKICLYYLFLIAFYASLYKTSFFGLSKFLGFQR